MPIKAKKKTTASKLKHPKQKRIVRSLKEDKKKSSKAKSTIIKEKLKSKAKAKLSVKPKLKVKAEKSLTKPKISKINKTNSAKNPKQLKPIKTNLPKTMGIASTVSRIQPYKSQPHEEYMNAEQRKHFKQILTKWELELMEEVDRTVHHMQDSAENFPDPNDRATQEEEFSLELRTRDRERKLMKKIKEALHKIENNEYGYCDACGAEIGVRRLEARPTATLCIDCKTLDEIREKQIGN